MFCVFLIKLPMAFVVWLLRPELFLVVYCQVAGGFWVVARQGILLILKILLNRSWNTKKSFKWWLFTLTLSLRMVVWMLNLLHDKLKTVHICEYMINVKDKQKLWWNSGAHDKEQRRWPYAMRDGGGVESWVERCHTLQTRPSCAQLFPKTTLKYVLAQHVSLLSSGSLPCLEKKKKSPKCFPSHLNPAWLCKMRPMSQTGLSRPLPWFPHWQEQLKKREGVSHVTRGKCLHHVILLMLVNTQEVI